MLFSSFNKISFKIYLTLFLTVVTILVCSIKIFDLNLTPRERSLNQLKYYYEELAGTSKRVDEIINSEEYLNNPQEVRNLSSDLNNLESSISKGQLQGLEFALCKFS